MKKGLLIGCLSIVILFAMFIVLSPIIAMMDMWGLFDHASRNELEQAVHRSYENYGLTGQFELEKYEKNYTSVGGFVIHGTYTENIDGKTYQTKTRFEYYTRPSEKEKTNVSSYIHFPELTPAILPSSSYPLVAIPSEQL